MELNKGKDNKVKAIFTGLHRVKVIAFNPTGQELVDLGLATEVKEQNYTYESQNSEGYIAKFFLESVDKPGNNANIAFFISKEQQESKSGLPFWVDTTGSNHWGEKEDAKYMDPLKAVPANQNTQKLVNFLKAWTRSLEIDLSDLQKIVKGDFSILKKFTKEVKDETLSDGSPVGLKTLWYVNENGYLTVYPNAFIRADRNIHKGFKKMVEEDDYNGLDTSLFQDTYEVKEYVTDLSVDKKTVEEQPTPEEKLDEWPAPGAEDTPLY